MPKRVGMPKMRPSKAGSSSALMMGPLSSRGTGLILSNTSRGSVSATCAQCVWRHARVLPGAAWYTVVGGWGVHMNGGGSAPPGCS